MSYREILSGFEISDVLAINDKDYSITFGLYFSVEWLEPRLNLSMELWGEENVAGEDVLLPGEIQILILHVKLVHRLKAKIMS